MARRFALVPESWLSTLQNGETKKTTNHGGVNFENVDGTKNNLGNLVDLLPKNLQNRARMLLHYIENVNVNDAQRIVYSDGSVGSHIVDLIRYAVSPFVKTRPIDWPQFSALLESNNVPVSALVNKGSSEKLPPGWKIY